MTESKHSKLWLYFSAIVFATITGALLIFLLLWIILFKSGVIPISPFGVKMPIIWVLFGSVLIGGMLALFVGKLIIKPIQDLSNAFGRLSKGDFDVRINENEKITEINEMAKCFNSTVYDLSHIETLRNDFVVNVSHEFKTPIAAIEGYATLLQSSSLTEEKRNDYIEKIIDNSQRLSELVTNILALSKLENQQNVPDKKEYRLDEQIRKSVLLLEGEWAKKNIEFDIDLPQCTYYASEALLEQVWYNLIDNAIKYSSQGEKIGIKLSMSESNICVSVCDNGCGISQDAQKHIFEKFYQADTSRKSKGNGLGLALVKRIVDMCGGEISVESQPDVKTEFIVTLPNT